MTTKKLFTAACVAAITVLCLDAGKAAAQSPLNPAPPPTAPKSVKLPIDATATISFGPAQTTGAVSRKRIFERVGLKHDQIVDVAVQYPITKVGHFITAEPLDGGRVIAAGKNLIVGADGMIYFKFHAGHNVGVYQVALHDGAQELGLQFWVLDEEHPEKNPHVVNSN